MRRRAAFYLLLGLTTALLIVALATGLQTGGSADPNVWMWAQRHVPLLQMLDLASVFLFVVIGLYGLTVSRMQVQLQHQAEDFGDQMQTLLHRNEELAKVNEEYADQIAALEAPAGERPALALGDSSQRVISALHWQVDAQAQQLEAVHQALEHQHNALQELQQQMRSLGERTAPSLTGSTEAAPQPAETSPQAEELKAESSEAESFEEQEAAPENEKVEIADWTVNDGSTLIGGTLEFDVSAFASADPAPSSSPQTVKPAEASPTPSPQTVRLAEARTYPVDDSMLAVAAGHLSRMPDAAPTSSHEPERIEISVGKAPASPLSSEAGADDADLSPSRTQGALALDLAESALSSLKSETQEALSSLRAQVEATIPKEPVPTVSVTDPEKSAQSSRRKPWHLRF